MVGRSSFLGVRARIVLLQTLRYCVEGRPSHLIFRESPKGEVRRINLPRSTVHTVGSNRPRYRREEACPRETSACSQTYDAENTTTRLKWRYGKRYIS